MSHRSGWGSSYCTITRYFYRRKLMPGLVQNKTYVFDANHVFYGELVTYAITQVALSITYTSTKGKPLPNLILNKGIVTHSVLLNPQAILSKMYPNVRNVGSAIEYCEASISGESGKRKAPDYFVPPAVWQTIAQVCLGSAYERISARIKNLYGKDPWLWPPKLQYMRHVRNGCFHKNRFNLRKPPKHPTAINPCDPPKWRMSVLQDDASVSGQPVLGKYLNSGDVPILLADIAEILTIDSP